MTWARTHGPASYSKGFAPTATRSSSSTNRWASARPNAWRCSASRGWPTGSY